MDAFVRYLGLLRFGWADASARPGEDTGPYHVRLLTR